MKTFIKLIISLSIISAVSQAQVAEYYFAKEIGTYAPLATETILWSGTFDNGVSTISIPSFTLNGIAYTSMTISINGFISFGSTVPADSYAEPISGPTAYNAAISPFGLNLHNAASGTPKISYNTDVDGEIVVQWQDVKRYSATGDVASFQVRLDPATSKISIVYGSVTTTYTGSSYGLQVGLRGSANTDYQNRTTASNWSSTTAGTSNGATCMFKNTVYPASGLTFTWKPLYNPLNFNATGVSLSQIDLNWQKNSLNHNVMLAFNTSNMFGTPVSGQVYSAGNTITGGGTVLFYGSGTSFSHSGLSSGTNYFYKIWSYDAVPDYSSGVATNTRTAYALPYLQAFPTSSLPAEWLSDLSRSNEHGTSGTYGLYKRLYSSAATGYATAPLAGSITANTYLSFHYRFVDYLGFPYVATTLGVNEKLEIQVSTDYGATFSTLHTIDYTNHTATTVFTNKAISLAAYAGDFIRIKFLCTRESGDYYFDLDNVLIEDGTNMSYTSNTVEQPNLTNVAINSTDNDILRLEVVTQKSSNPLSLTSITFNTTGSDNPGTNIAAAKVFFTTTPVFSTGTQFGSTLSNPSGTFTITGSQELAQGNNYFWLAYDIKSTATPGNVVDGQCTKFITSESVSDKLTNKTTITGNRKIGAVVNGVKTVPGDYATIAEAVGALNNGVVGPDGVTVNVAAGYLENITAPIVLTATGSSTQSIIFQKSGTGNNPLITRTDAGTVNTTTIGYHGDGVIIVGGSDYVTFEGIDVAATDAGIEYGYYIRKASVTDACSHVTVKNCNISMNKGSSRYVVGFCAASNGPSGAITPTSPGGAHQHIVFTGNTIGSVFTGIFLKGHTAFSDHDYTIGATGAGNTIQNFGGVTTYEAYGIYIENVDDGNVSYNTINNTAGGGSGFTQSGNGIYHNNSSALTCYITHNNVSISMQSVTYGHYLYGIRNIGNGETAIEYNNISLTNTVSSENAFYYIFNNIGTASNASQSISYNTFTGTELLHTNFIYLIYNPNGQQAPAVMEIQGNTISGTITRTGTYGSFYLYYNNGPMTGTEIISGNNFSNITQSGSSAFYGIYSYPSAVGTTQIYDNTISGISNGTGLFRAIDVANQQTKYIHGNQISGITSGGDVTAINLSSGVNTCHIYENNITDISTSYTSTTNGKFNGILIISGTNVYVYNNFISDLRASAAGAYESIRAISINHTAQNSFTGVYANTIYLEASSTGSTFGTTGVFHEASSVATTSTLDLRDNIIINKSTPNGTNGFTSALRRSSTAYANFAETSDHNILFAGTPGPKRLIYYDGINYQTLQAYQAWIAPREANSHSEDPPFVNVSTSPFDLHMQTSVATLAEGSGQLISSPIAINTDYDGDTRSATPDIGADEFAGISAFVENPGSFAAEPWSSQQVRLNFTLNSSSDDVVIVYSTVSSFTPPAGTPVVGMPLANGTVIYVGPSSPYDHGGLTPGTTYYYKAYSYDGASYSLGLATQAAPAVNPVSVFNTAAASQTQVNLGWTRNNAGHDVIIAAHTAYMSGNPVNGTVYNVNDAVPSGGTIIYKGPASSFSHNSLNTWTQYYYKAWSYDAYNYYSSGSTANELTYGNAVTAYPYLMDFGSGWSHDPEAPFFWKVVDVGGSGYFTWVRQGAGYRSAPYCIRGYEIDTANDYLISPPLILPSANLQISWYDKVSDASSNNSYKVLLSTTDQQLTSFTTELGDFDCTNTDWTLRTISLNAYQGQTVFIAFRHYYSESQNEFFTIDDIMIETLQPSEALVLFPADELITYVNPELRWEPPVTNIPVAGYKVYMGTSSNPSTLVYDGPNTSYQTTGISFDVTRYWKVVPYNANGEATNVPVWSFSTVREAQLAESFEAEYFPPVGWSQDWGWNYSYLSFYHGLQSVAKLTNATPNKLITPLLDIISGDRLEFFAGTSTATNVKIQVMYSADKSTWNNLGSPLSISAGEWEFHSVNLSSLAGNQRYLALGAYNTSSGSSYYVYIDHLTGPDIITILPDTATNPNPENLDTYIPLTPELTWDPMSTGGIPAGYKVYLGTDPSSLGLIYDGPDEYCPAGTLNSGMEYFWKVVPYNTEGDALNCPVWSFTTQPLGGLQIGRGMETYLDLPIHTDYHYSYSQTIYLQSEIDLDNQRIKKIYYQWNGAEEGVAYKDWIVYMGHTSKAEFSNETDWIPLSQMAKVFDGEVALPDTETWIEIVLDIPFNYNNMENLVIAVDENTYGSRYENALFYGTDASGSRAIKYYDDLVNPDPANPPMTETDLESGFANIRLQLDPVPTGPEISVTPVTKDFGSLIIFATSTPYAFEIKNTGIGTLTISDVDLTGTSADQFILTDTNTYPKYLAANQSIEVKVEFAPDTEGFKSASLAVMHSLPASPSLYPLSGTGLNGSLSALPFIETFEDYTPTGEMWHTECIVGLTFWGIWWGGNGSVTSANTGLLNAAFYGPMNDITKYKSPYIDLTGVSNPELRFWFVNEMQGTALNIFRVYYRIHHSAPWNEIYYSHTNTPNWTEIVLSLPNPSAMYQIAFEGQSLGGYSTLVDDVRIGEPAGPNTMWKGNVSDDWSDPANWTNGVPDPTYEAIVMISGNFEPTISTDVTIYNLIIEPGANITIAEGGSLTVINE